MVEQDRIKFVKSKLLSSKSIKLKNQWISECVQFYIQQCPTIDNDTLVAQTLEQFLFAELADASDPVIPASIGQKREAFELTGTFVVQLVYLIDIAESPYDQWRKLHNKTLDEADDGREPKTFQAKKKRVFKLELTDGYKTFTAMEYKTLPILNTKLSPGLKVQIIGPLKVVNHILLLEPKNLEILGGDVDRLLVVNAYENVLLRALKRPTTDTPITDYTEAPVIAENHAPRRQIEAKPMLASKKVELKPPVSAVLKQDEEFLASLDFDDLDEDIDMATIEQLEEEGRQRLMNKEPARNQNQPTRSNNQPIDDDEEFLADIDFNAVESQLHVKPRPESRPLQQKSAPQQKPPAPQSKPPERMVSCNDASTSSSVVPQTLNPPAAPAINIPPVATPTHKPPAAPVISIQPEKVYTIADDLYKFKSTDGDNFATIDQFLALKASDKMKRNFVLKAKMHEVVPKTLKVKSNKWTVRAEISDAFSERLLPVKMSNEVLELLSGHSGEKMSLMHIESKTRMNVKEEIYDIVEALQRNIEDLFCFMKIEMEFNPQEPACCQVIQLLEPDDDNYETYQRKVAAEKLEKVM